MDLLHGLLFYPLSVAWIDFVMHQYGNVDPWTSAAILALIAIAGGLICAVFSWAIALAARKSNALACVLAPFLWVTLEFARGHLPIIAFPWNFIGYAISGNLPLVQIATVTGIYGLSFIVVAFSSLAAYAYVSGTDRNWKIVLAAAGVIIVIAFGGGYFVPRAEPRFLAHLVQTNFPQSEEYPADWLQIHARELDGLEDLSVDAVKRFAGPGDSSGAPPVSELPGLIVWPEVPAPFSLQDQPFADRARRIAQDSASDFLVGVADWKPGPPGMMLASNTAVLLDPAGRRVFTYDKIHLVPFGEYVPLRDWLTFAGKLTADIGDFTPGKTYSVGRTPYGSFGTFICFEAVFPGDVRRFTLNGANLLINISNDGWFGRSSAPAQHLMMARVRAVENRRWLLRDTNNGFTVSVDPYGRIVAELATDIRGQLNAPYDFRSDLTLYVRWGDWFAWLCVFGSFGLLGYAIVRKFA